MSTLTKIGFFAIFAILCIPFIRDERKINVDVNWSIQEATPTDRTVTIQGLSFTVPVGHSVKQAIELRGGGSGAALYSIQGWGFIGQQLTVDGKEIPLHQIRTGNRRGELRILGIGKPATMDATIAL